MAKRYTVKDDEYIAHFYSKETEDMVARDLNRSVASVRSRVKALRDSGALKAHYEAQLAGYRFARFRARLPSDEAMMIEGLERCVLSLIEGLD